MILNKYDTHKPNKLFLFPKCFCLVLYHGNQMQTKTEIGTREEKVSVTDLTMLFPGMIMKVFRPLGWKHLWECKS